MTSNLFQDLVSAGRDLLAGTFVQYLFVIGVCILFQVLAVDRAILRLLSAGFLANKQVMLLIRN